MRETMLQMEYFETYYYANVIHNVLSDPMPYMVNLHGWHEERATSLFLASYPKWSALHSLAEYIITSLIYERLHEVSLGSVIENSGAELWVDRALKHHGITSSGFRSWLQESGITLSEVTEDDIYNYHCELTLAGELEKLIIQLTEEVFYVLFSNRLLLQRLNYYISGIVSDIDIDDLDVNSIGMLDKNGVPARLHIPVWARRAVYHRDRAQCSSCLCDLSGRISVSSEEHFDHIIPLAQGGINDVTNLQLLCRACNLKKGSKIIQVSSKYEAWYSHDI
ncbi:HNH endonuclease [Aeromonas veronii]|uniref:HNH endonuclease n=1 Tax=Aeromonas veronii TaxID=654 RepID=UPI001E2C6A2F|nr:HNH endonuclease signature motif containing protein [Aeromonas veronii]MCD6618149.1 HNH endonuclease [Aeromonas veronii]